LRQAERRVPGLRLELDLGRVGLPDLDQLLETGRGDAVARRRRTRGHLDPEDPAAVRGGQDGRRAGFAAGDVEHAALAVEA
jgi:hypothetical protein